MTALTQDALFTFLDELGIETTTVQHKPVFTVKESNGIDRELPGGHTKNLFLKDAKDRLYLVIAHTGTEVDLKGLPKQIGSARLSFGKPELLREALGVSPGSVTAFALASDDSNRVRVIVDQDLLEFESVNCHPLHNDATTNIARDDFLRFIRATGHEPKIVDLKKQDGLR